MKLVIKMAHHLLETRGQDNGHLRCQPRIGVLAHNRMAGRRYLGWGTGRQGQTGGQNFVNWRGKDLQLVWFTEISPWFDYEKVVDGRMEPYFGDRHGDCHGGTMVGPMIPTAWDSHPMVIQVTAICSQNCGVPLVGPVHWRTNLSRIRCYVVGIAGGYGPNVSCQWTLKISPKLVTIPILAYSPKPSILHQ